MINIDIPGANLLELNHLALDFNGTLACDGKRINGVANRLQMLSEYLEIHVVTADTFGSVQEELSDLPCTCHIIPRDQQDEAKRTFVKHLDATSVVAIGNGRNDGLMLKESALGIIVIQTEGTAVQSLTAADVVCTHICDALDLLLHPDRLRATLRN